jgi:hypothetical protein
MAGYQAAYEFGSQEFRLSQMQKQRQGGFDFTNPLGDFPFVCLPGSHLAIENLPEPNDVYRWLIPRPVHALLIEDGTLEVLIGTFGLETSELPELFSHIRRIDNRPDVLTRYESESKSRWAELGHADP